LGAIYLFKDDLLSMLVFRQEDFTKVAFGESPERLKLLGRDGCHDFATGRRYKIDGEREQLSHQFGERERINLNPHPKAIRR